MTNFEKIKSLTVEEMTRWLIRNQYACFREMCEAIGEKTPRTEEEYTQLCAEEIKQWLESEEG